MVVMPRQTIKRFLHFALCLDGVGRSIFPASRVCVLPSNSERVWS
nr:MAG TPA: hypothetical protein [Caudoviricetes sp.]